MTTSNLDNLLRSSSANVLETMFFADAESADPSTAHDDPLACALTCSGAQNGAFTVAIDRPALALLCEAFYGDDDASPVVRQRELLCELTNMLAGSTLSAFIPDHYCPLSSPMLCNLDRHLQTTSTTIPGALHASTLLALDGGLLSISCALKAAESQAAA